MVISAYLSTPQSSCALAYQRLWKPQQQGNLFNFLNQCFPQEDYFCHLMPFNVYRTSAPWSMLRNRILTLMNYLFPLAFSISHQIFMNENFYTFSTKAKCPCLLWTEDWATFSITVPLRALCKDIWQGTGSPAMSLQFPAS